MRERVRLATLPSKEKSAVPAPVGDVMVTVSPVMLEPKVTLKGAVTSVALDLMEGCGHPTGSWRT